jgi:predicted hydrocarbon binding protein
MTKFNVDWNKQQNIRLVEKSSLVFHCHHYNCHLQKTIEDAQIVDGKGIQINVAREVAFNQFSKAYSLHPELKTTKQKLDFAAELFQVQGFGKVVFTKIDETGGVVKVPVSHYAKGWVTKWGKRFTPVCLFNTGWIAGVLAAVYDKQRYHYEVTETDCIAVTSKECVYTVGVR